MILTVLGANGPYPSAGGACSGYLLSSDSGETKLLLDCGSGVLARLAELCPVSELSAVVLSHLHYDHMSDILPMQYQLDFEREAPLKVFCPATPARQRSLLGGRLDLYPMRDAAVGEMKLEFLPVNHPVETYAVRVSCDGATMVYTGDTNRCPALSLFADGAALLLADAGLSEADWTDEKPHLNPRLCAELAKEARVGALVLTHLSPRYDAEALLDEARPVFPDVRLAQAGLCLRV